MQPREKKLAVAIAAMLLLWGGWVVYGYWTGAVAARTSQIDKHRGDIRKKEAQVKRGNDALRRLNEWQKRSLPTDKQRARSLYQNWLLGLIEKAKLTGADLSTQNMRGRQDVYDGLGFTITGEATLEQLTTFLYEFYGSGHLDQVRRMHLQPIEKTNRLKVNLVVEGVILPNSPNKDALSQEPVKRLAKAELKDYIEPITKRNFFAEYTPPPPVKPIVEAPKIETKPAFDPAKQAVVSAILEVNSRPEVWVRVKTTDQTFRLGEGEKLEVGTFKGTVGRIGLRDVELLGEGKRWLVAIGENVGDAVAIGDDQAKAPSPVATE